MSAHLPIIAFVCSAELVELVWIFYPAQNPRKKLLAVFLAWRADDDGKRIYPFVATMAKRIGCDPKNPRQVQRYLREMQDEGFLEVYKPGCGRNATIYNITEGWMTAKRAAARKGKD
jgi:Helix-turn-helix domain